MASPTQEDVEFVAQRSRKRILRYLEKHGVVPFGSEIVCLDCGGPLRLIALVAMEETVQAILAVMPAGSGPTGPP